jgi:hypothetical protein
VGLTVIYLGNGIVLTANHVGPGDVTFDGVTYGYVPGSAVQLSNGDGTYADLVMFEIYPRPDLPELEIPLLAPLYRSLVVTIGNGFDRGAPLVWDPNGASPPGPTGGYAWAGQSHIRWGLNYLEVYPAGGRVFGTKAFGSFFDANTELPESQAVIGDSGGAVFTLSFLFPYHLQLAGVILGIMQYSGQPANTSFYGQKTYYADLSFYRSQLMDAVNLPEPDRALAPAASLIAWLACRRRGRPVVSSTSRCARAGA